MPGVFAHTFFAAAELMRAKGFLFTSFFSKIILTQVYHNADLLFYASFVSTLELVACFVFAVRRGLRARLVSVHLSIALKPQRG